MDVAAAHAMLEAADPLGAFCADRQLWGALAGNVELEAAIRAGVERVEMWLESRRSRP